MSAPLNPYGEAFVEPRNQPSDRPQRRLRYLLRAINTSYDTVLQEIAFDGLTVELLRVADVDALLDRFPKVQFRPDERLPYWADLWPSSLALAKYLWEAGDLRGVEVLEIGCGLGLAGIVASRKGGKVTCTDYEADALTFTRYNVLRNDCRQAIVRHLDWHAPALSQTYGVIVASDILYERVNFQPLLSMMQSALRPDGHFILAEPNRPVARDFFRLLRDHGFQYARSTADVEVGGERCEVSIYHGKRKHA
ncbi:MAG TPA: methyltransferase domain-containing protein [Candidatus Tectomicrobia bacterium]|nr:methyltransferase domain-containing protein [Candidatus Tectomicrobia bacterium]